MKLNSKVTWGLAWAGLAVVLAVPSADYLTGQFGLRGNSAAVITSTTDPVTTGSTGAAPQKTAAVTTTITKTGVKIIPAGSATPGAPVLDPVDKFVNSGKQLPDYISDGDSAQTTPAAPTTGAPVLGAPADEPTQVANLDTSPTIIPPVPFPRRPPDLPRPARPTEPTVIVDEGSLPVDDSAVPVDGDGMPDQLAVTPDGPLPPAGIQDDWQKARDRRLTRYLEQNGLIEGAAADGRSSASVTIVGRPSDYDPNGFYLSDGPNNSKAERRKRIMRMLEDEGDVSWF